MALEQHLNRCEGSSDPARQAAAAAGSSQPPADPAATAAAAAAAPPEQAWGPTTLQQLRCQLQHFAAERDWGQYHTPRNLLLALTGEVGELAECFQWKGEVGAGLPEFSPAERQHVAEELADVLLYLVRLSDACHVDLAAAAADKLCKNERKYPADRCRGSSAKYTRYTDGGSGGGDVDGASAAPASAAADGSAGGDADGAAAAPASAAADGGGGGGGGSGDGSGAGGGER